MEELVYVNGQFVRYGEAVLPVEDRGTVFADGIYEVIRFYAGRPFMMTAHLDRLVRSAKEIALPPIDIDAIQEAGLRLARENQIGDGNLYIQVTRGVAPRSHAFPKVPVAPTVFMTARSTARPDESKRKKGIRTITTVDDRWHRCHIKSIALLPNVLAKQKAAEAGAMEALFVRDGRFTEGSSSNLFGVKDGILLTHPDGPLILPGITRQTVLAFASQKDIPVHFRAMGRDELTQMDELFLTGTNTEVLGIVQVDNVTVGDGQVGPITRRLQLLYDALVDGVRKGGTADFVGGRFIAPAGAAQT